MYRQIQIFDYAEMLNGGTTKYLLIDYKDYVKSAISDARNSIRIDWFKSVERLFKQVLTYL